MILMSLLQEGLDTDVEDIVREGESRKNGESNINIHTLSGVRWIAGRSCYVAQEAQSGVL